MKIFVVRHGETVENKRRILMGHHHGTLTRLGIKQAREVANKLKNHDFAHIYSSDLQRCVDTAELIKEFHPNTALTFTKELREVNMGGFQGKGWDEVNWDSLGSDKMNRKPKGGESLSELKKRVIKYVQDLNKIHSKDKLLLVTHAGVIRQMISHFEHLSNEYVFENFPVENGDFLQIDISKNLTGKVVNLSKAQKKVD